MTTVARRSTMSRGTEPAAGDQPRRSATSSPLPTPIVVVTSPGARSINSRSGAISAGCESASSATQHPAGPQHPHRMRPPGRVLGPLGVQEQQVHRTVGQLGQHRSGDRRPGTPPTRSARSAATLARASSWAAPSVSTLSTRPPEPRAASASQSVDTPTRRPDLDERSAPRRPGPGTRAARPASGSSTRRAVEAVGLGGALVPLRGRPPTRRWSRKPAHPSARS